MRALSFQMHTDLDVWLRYLKTSRQFNFLPGVVVDTTPIGKSFGAVSTDVAASSFSLSTPNLIISAVFWGADPRNNFQSQTTYLSVDQQVNGYVVDACSAAICSFTCN